jgi:proline iminopeptidase
MMFPEEFERFSNFIPPVERHDLMSAYHRRLHSADPEVRLAAAKAWTRWEMATSKLYIDQDKIEKSDKDTAFSTKFAMIENHYFVHGGFLEFEDQLITNGRILEEHAIPGVIVQGRYDVVCPAVSAFDLSKVWNRAELVVVPDAGHSMEEPGITHHLIEATERFKNI